MSVGKMIKIAQEQCNVSCYVWGAKGQNMLAMKDVESWVDSMEKTDIMKPENIIQIMSRFNKLKAAGVNPIKAFDCSGFVYYCMHNAGYKYDRTSAKYYYSMCKEIGREDLRPGDFVFGEKNGVIVHIGLYIGDNQVIHSKGRAYGVVQENFSVYKTWNRFGYLPDIRDGEYLDPECGCVCDETEPDERPYIYFKGSFNVRELPSTKGKKLGIVHKGQSLEWLGDEENGWHKVVWSLKDGYVTGNPDYEHLMEMHNEKAY